MDQVQGIFFAAFLLLSQSNQTQNGISSKWRDRSSIDSIDFFSLGQHFWGRTNSDGCVVKVILSIPAE